MPLPLIVFTASLSKKLIKCCTWSIALYGAETWTFGKQITNTLLFGNVVLEKDGDQLDQLCEKLSITRSQRRKEQPAYNKMLEG